MMPNAETDMSDHHTTLAGGARPPARGRSALRAAAAVAGAAGFLLLLRLAYDLIGGVPLPSPPACVVGLSLLLVHYLVAAEGWRLLLGDLGAAVGRRDAWRAWIESSYGTYLPGKVWAYAARMTAIAGLPTAAVGASLVLETALTAVAGGAWALAALGARTPAAAVLLAAAAVAVALAGGPRLFARLLPQAPLPSPRRLAGRLGVFALAWAAYGAGHAVLLRSALGDSAPGFVAVTGCLAAAWLVGMAAVLFPAGIGAADGAAVALLSLFVPAPAAVAAAVIARLSNLSGHALLAVALVPLGFRRGR